MFYFRVILWKWPISHEISWRTKIPRMNENSWNLHSFSKKQNKIIAVYHTQYMFLIQKIRTENIIYTKIYIIIWLNYIFSQTTILNNVFFISQNMSNVSVHQCLTLSQYKQLNDNFSQIKSGTFWQKNKSTTF